MKSIANVRRLLVVSHVPHFEHAGRLFAYGPYAREIDIWAELFPEIIIAAPLRREPPPGDSIPFSRGNISVAPQLETGGETMAAKVLQCLVLPAHFWRLARALSRADAIQVRCPGNLGLLGCLLAPCFRKPLVAKYANQWKDFSGEPLTYRWQKRLLRSGWWRGPVLVYGEWPNQPANIVPFFTSIVNETQMDRARSAAAQDWFQRPLEILYVGRLSPDKNVDVIIKAMARQKKNLDGARLTIVGDGPVRGELESLVAKSGLGGQVVFAGAVPHAQVLDFYERARVLVLASQSEGWPKAITEAMAFGLVCIGSDRGLVPQMLAGGRGLLVEPRNPDALVEKLEYVFANPAAAAGISKAAAAWSQKFTLEGLRHALDELLQKRWEPIAS